MAEFLQQVINGLTLGSIYGLIAIGYTMVFGIIGMVNFAHGDVFPGTPSPKSSITGCVRTNFSRSSIIPTQPTSFMSANSDSSRA